jgi:hypothetical protein
MDGFSPQVNGYQIIRFSVKKKASKSDQQFPELKKPSFI